MRLPLFLVSVPILLLAMLAANAQAAADDPEPAYAPIRPYSACLDPARVRGWHMLDNRSLLIDAGRRKYRIDLLAACPELGHNPFLALRGSQPGGRVCGNLGEAVIPRGSRANIRQECRIQRIVPLDEAAWDALTGKSGNAAPVAESPDA